MTDLDRFAAWGHIYDPAQAMTHTLIYRDLSCKLVKRAMARSIYQTVLSAFDENDEVCLRDVYGSLSDQVNASRITSAEELFANVNSASSPLGRNFVAEQFVPRYATEAKSCTALRYCCLSFSRQLRILQSGAYDRIFDILVYLAN